MLKIRLMRIGGKKKPFYRVVVQEERSKRTGGYVELLGTYNPLTEPKEVKINQERVDHWVKQGAQLSEGYLRIIGKAPQRPPRKPKKEKKEEPKQAEVKTEEPAAEEKPAEETPAEQPAETVTEVPAAEEVASEPEATPEQEEKKDEGSA